MSAINSESRSRTSARGLASFSTHGPAKRRPRRSTTPSRPRQPRRAEEREELAARRACQPARPRRRRNNERSNEMRRNLASQVAADELVDHQPRGPRRMHALADEQLRIGSFATGLAKDEPRPWNGKQMVGARQSGRVGALPDEP